MKGWLLTIVIASLCVGEHVSAQGLDDALRFSQKHVHGSARFNAMGGAFTALGGEMGAIHVNPASVGVFTKNEIGFTLGVGHTSINSAYYGNSENAQYGKANANNLGIVFSSELDHPDWGNLNVGLTYTRTNDFNRRIKYSGEQDEHSYAQYLTGIANSEFNYPEDLEYYYPFDVYPAYSAYVIDNLSEGEYYSPIGVDEPVHQELTMEESGRSSEFMVSLGTSYQNRLYMGAGLKVGSFNLTRTLDHTETPENQKDIVRHHFGTDLEIRGTSYSFSGGIIARLTDMFRIGISAQTPHFYVHNEYFSSFVDAELAGSYQEYADTTGGSYGASVSPDGNNRYNFNTPWVFTGGIAAVFGPRAILSAEYEFQNYSSGRFRRNARSGSNYDYDYENEDIQETLGATHNLRAGFEYRLLPFSIRAGYAYYMDPVKPSFRGSVDRSIHQISFGAGMRFEKIYLDASYYYRTTHSQYGLYDVGYNEYAGLDIVRHGIAFTIGVRY